MRGALLLLCYQYALASALAPLTDVFVGGTEGYACYRIPALLLLNETRLLAFAEARRFSCNDHGWVDLVVKVSHDSGATWSAHTLVHSASSPAQNVTIGNPAPLLTPDGRVLLPFCINNTAAAILSSSDGGASWALLPDSLPIEANWGWVATGPPGSLVTSSGRLVVPGDHTSGSNTEASHVWLSDDGGRTWRMTAPIVGGNEAQIAALSWVSSDALLLSMRTGGATRQAAVSMDGGETWSAPWHTIAEVPCEASIIALPQHPKGARLIQSSAFSTKRRENLSLHASTDEGHTWELVATVYPGSAAYSSLAPVGAGGASVGVLFERDGYARISFAVVRV